MEYIKQFENYDRDIQEVAVMYKNTLVGYTIDGNQIRFLEGDEFSDDIKQRASNSRSLRIVKKTLAKLTNTTKGGYIKVEYGDVIQYVLEF
jgi:hypothetical protein